MVDLEERVAQAAAGMNPGWDDAHVEAALAVLHRRRRQQRALIVAVPAAVLLMGALGGWLLRGTSRDDGGRVGRVAEGESSAAPALPGGSGGNGAGGTGGVGAVGLSPHEASAPAPAVVENPAEVGTPAPVVAATDPNGWTASPADEKSSITLASETPSEVRLALKGSGRFQADPRSGRTVHVQVMEMAVVLQGGRIEIEQKGGQVWVAVREGRTRVEWARETRTLTAGQEAWFPTNGARAEVAPSPAGHAAVADAAAPAAPAPVAPSPPEADWRALARKGSFDEAFTALSADQDAVRDDAEDLLLAADTARLSGHANAALPYLDRVLADHRGDSRAPIAAFSRGRILLELEQTADAALAFHLSRDLAPSGALAEDALAREVEALSRAGQSQRAHDLAAEYVRAYPTGAWLRSVRRYGGL